MKPNQIPNAPNAPIGCVEIQPEKGNKREQAVRAIKVPLRGKSRQRGS